MSTLAALKRIQNFIKQSFLLVRYLISSVQRTLSLTSKHAQMMPINSPGHSSLQPQEIVTSATQSVLIFYPALLLNSLAQPQSGCKSKENIFPKPQNPYKKLKSFLKLPDPSCQSLNTLSPSPSEWEGEVNTSPAL